MRDEIEYQTARNKRENQMMQMYNQQGINGNYPQYGTNFWGNTGNNYGFGSSNITDAISTHPAMNTTPVTIPQTPQTSLKQQNYSTPTFSTPSFDEAQRILQIVQQKPVETNEFGQNVYWVRSKYGTFKVVTSLKDGDNIVSSMYYPTR